MTNSININNVVKNNNLIAVLADLVVVDVPCDCWDDDGTHANGHWSGTKDAMESYLGRRLMDGEVICLSLSRCFGPTPGVSDSDSIALFNKVWPNGNSAGSWIEWAELSDKLAPKTAVQSIISNSKLSKNSDPDCELFRALCFSCDGCMADPCPCERDGMTESGKWVTVYEGDVENPNVEFVGKKYGLEWVSGQGMIATNSTTKVTNIDGGINDYPYGHHLIVEEWVVDIIKMPIDTQTYIR